MWLPVLEAAHYAGNGLILAEGSHRWVVVTKICAFQKDIGKFWEILGNLGFSLIARRIPQLMTILIDKAQVA